ncbi:hypothetical protein KL938_002080 [Ogataea parapolymorpha]|nr:hypothetical protein KL938_002080 [Ogataea parapolymorpha]
MLSFKTLCATAFAFTAVSAAPQADPFAFANAIGLPVAAEATYACHASCGYAILAARQCSPTGSEDANYNSTCLCASDSQFLSYVPACLDCGWCLWSDYGSFLTSALAECHTNTQPTGTTCAPSTAQAAATSSVAAAVSEVSSSSAAASSTQAATAASSTAVASTEATTSAAAAATSSSEAASSSAHVHSHAAESTSAVESTSAAHSHAAESSSAAHSHAAESSSAAHSHAAGSSSAASNSSGHISTFSGAGAKLAVGAGAGIVGLAALLM